MAEEATQQGSDAVAQPEAPTGSAGIVSSWSVTSSVENGKHTTWESLLSEPASYLTLDMVDIRKSNTCKHGHWLYEAHGLPTGDRSLYAGCPEGRH